MKFLKRSASSDDGSSFFRRMSSGTTKIRRSSTANTKSSNLRNSNTSTASDASSLRLAPNGVEYDTSIFWEAKSSMVESTAEEFLRALEAKNSKS